MSARNGIVDKMVKSLGVLMDNKLSKLAIHQPRLTEIRMMTHSFSIKSAAHESCFFS